MKFHDELNPKLWNKDKTLKDEVADKLEEIAEAFIEYLEINPDAIKDVVITGSSASYNYTPHSDLDLHLKVDYDMVHEDCPIVEGFLWSMKSQFNKDHDISIYGVPVELYAESIEGDTVHNGLYSLMNAEWIDEPQKIPPTDNDDAVLAKYNEIKEAAEKIEDSEVAEELINKIYEMRKAGLADAGEFSTENLAFKKLRDEGILERLKQMKKEKIDKQLSLESYNDNKQTQKRNIILEAGYEKILLCTSDSDSYFRVFLCKGNNDFKIATQNLWSGNLRYLKSYLSPKEAIDNLVKSMKRNFDPSNEFKFNNNEFSQYLKTKIAELRDIKNSEEQWGLISIGSYSMGGEYWQLDKTDKGFSVFRFVDGYRECYSRNQKSAEEALDKAVAKVGRQDGMYDSLSTIVENNDISEFYDNEYSKYFYTKAIELYNKMYPEQAIKLESFEKKDIDKQLSLESYNESLQVGEAEILEWLKQRQVKVGYGFNKLSKEGTAYYMAKLINSLDENIINKIKEADFSNFNTKEFTLENKEPLEAPKVVPCNSIITHLVCLYINPETNKTYSEKPTEEETLHRSIKIKMNKLYNKKTGWDRKGYYFLQKNGNKYEIVTNLGKGQHEVIITANSLQELNDILAEKLNKGQNNSKNESIKEEFFVGNDKYIIVPVSYVDNDIRILDKKTGEFLKDKNGGNLKFPTEDECANYIKSLEESIKEDYEDDDYEDIPEEMHKERYVTYFETPEGRQKYTIYHVYTDSTDDSYNELCDKRDNQLGMYNSYKELKDALKERAEKIAAKQGWTVKSIDNLGEDDDYYRERNKWESIKEEKLFKHKFTSLPAKSPKLNIGDKVIVNGKVGEVITIKPMKLSDTSTYKIKLDDGRTIWRYEEEINPVNESSNKEFINRLKEVLK